MKVGSSFCKFKGSNSRWIASAPLSSVTQERYALHPLSPLLCSAGHLPSPVASSSASLVRDTAGQDALDYASYRLWCLMARWVVPSAPIGGCSKLSLLRQVAPQSLALGFLATRNAMR